MTNVKQLILGSCFLLATGAAGAAEGRSYASGHSALTLNGAHCGLLKAVSGGDVGAAVIDEPGAASGVVKKHLGSPRYDEFAVQLGWSMTDPVYDWIAGMWKNDFQRLDGSIFAASFDMDIKSERQFTRALLTEVTIPAMDGAAKEPGYLTVKFAPETVRRSAGSGKISADSGKQQQKAWLPSNFRLEIDGLDCSRVIKVDAFTVKRRAATNETGDARNFSKEPGKLELPILRITLAESSGATWVAWLDDFVVKGNNGDSKEREGTLTLLSANRQETLARIKFHNLGICRLGQEDSEAGSEQVARLVADLYVERLEFQAGKALASDAAPAAAPPTPPLRQPGPSIRKKG